jgi:hypothetical protein
MAAVALRRVVVDEVALPHSCQKARTSFGAALVLLLPLTRLSTEGVSWATHWAPANGLEHLAAALGGALGASSRRRSLELTAAVATAAGAAQVTRPGHTPPVEEALHVVTGTQVRAAQVRLVAAVALRMAVAFVLRARQYRGRERQWWNVRAGRPRGVVSCCGQHGAMQLDSMQVRPGATSANQAVLNKARA